MGFPVGWTKYQIIPINGSSDGELTDYQVEITVPFQSGMKSDFGDIRFLDSNEITELSYHLVSYTASTSAVFVVKIPVIPTVGKNIYMYFGNPNVTTTSNPKNVYTIFDDFTDSIIDPMWTIQEPCGTAVPSDRVVEGSDGLVMNATKPCDWWCGECIGSPAISTPAPSNPYEAIVKITQFDNIDQTQAGIVAYTNENQAVMMFRGRWNISGWGNGAYHVHFENGTCSNSSASTGAVIPLWVKIRFTGTQYLLYFSTDGINWTLQTTRNKLASAYAKIGMYVKNWGSSSTVVNKFREFRVSKFTTNMPTIGTFGSVVDFSLEATYFRAIFEVEPLRVKSHFRGKFKVVEDVVSRFRGKFEIAPEKVRFRTKLMIREEKFKQFRAKFRTITSNPTYTSAIKRFRAKIEAIPIEKKRFRAKVNIDSGKTRLELFANVKLRQSEFEDSFEDFEFTIGDQKYDT